MAMYLETVFLYFADVSAKWYVRLSTAYLKRWCTGWIIFPFLLVTGSKRLSRVWTIAPNAGARAQFRFLRVGCFWLQSALEGDDDKPQCFCACRATPPSSSGILDHFYHVVHEAGPWIWNLRFWSFASGSWRGTIGWLGNDLCHWWLSIELFLGWVNMELADKTSNGRSKAWVTENVFDQYRHKGVKRVTNGWNFGWKSRSELRERLSLCVLSQRPRRRFFFDTIDSCTVPSDGEFSEVLFD